MFEIKSPEELSKIIDLCRKKGIETIKIDGIEMRLRDSAPVSNYKRKKNDQGEVSVEGIPGSDELLFWSSQGAEV